MQTVAKSWHSPVLFVFFGVLLKRDGTRFYTRKTPRLYMRMLEDQEAFTMAAPARTHTQVCEDHVLAMRTGANMQILEAFTGHFSHEEA